MSQDDPGLEGKDQKVCSVKHAFASEALPFRKLGPAPLGLLGTLL